MPRFYRPLASVLTVLLIVGCTTSAVDERPSSSADKAEESAAPEPVVTGTRTLPNARSAAKQAYDSRNFFPPAPPPPPGLYSQIVAPPYHDVGRDRFTAA